jgi:hypothetical protein
MECISWGTEVHNPGDKIMENEFRVLLRGFWRWGEKNLAVETWRVNSMFYCETLEK